MVEQTLLKKKVFAFADAARESVNRLIWPPVCLNCFEQLAESKDSLCPACWNKLINSTNPDYCPRCGQSASRYAILPSGCPRCINEQFYFDGIARAGLYSEALRKMIVDFKFSDRTELASILSMLSSSALEGCFFKNEIELFVPVPLHWSRKLFRGYNQSYLIAKKLSNGKIPISADLVRIRRTKYQTTLSDAKRAANVAGAFAARSDHNFSGKTICLVDDIKTTGATLNECAKILKDAGAAKVYALALAEAGRGMPDS